MSEFIGRKISLISKAGIRYEGILYTIDPGESTVALSKVKSFGTEERQVERVIGPRDEIYEFIIFRASDIQDLVVCEAGREASLLSEDSAIVRVAEATSGDERASECWDWLQAGRAPSTLSSVAAAVVGHHHNHGGGGGAGSSNGPNERSVWGPASSSALPGASVNNNTGGGSTGNSNHHPHLNVHHNKSSTVASSGDGANGSGVRREMPQSSSSVAPPASAAPVGHQTQSGQYLSPAQSQANQRLKAEARARLMKQSRNSTRDNRDSFNCGDYDGMNYRGSSQRDYYYYYSQQNHSKPTSRYNNNSNQYYNRRDNHNHPHQHQQYYNYYNYHHGNSANSSSNTAAAAAANAINNNTGTSGSDSSSKLRGFECSSISGAAAEQSNLSFNGPYHSQNQQQRHRGAASNHTGKSSQSAGTGAPNNTSANGANGNSHPNSGGGGGGGGKHKKKPARTDPADSDKKEGFKEDYDFETANAMIAQELANLHVSQDNNKKDVSNNENNGAREDGHLSDTNSDGGYYDKTKSFFDNISSEMTDRAKGKTVRPMNRKEERKINVETFGVAEANRSHGRNASKWNRNSRYYAKSTRGSNQSGTTFRGNAHANDSFKKDLPYKASRGYMSGGRRPILVDGPGRGDDY